MHKLVKPCIISRGANKVTSNYEFTNMRKITTEIDYVVPFDLYMEVVRASSPYLSAVIDGPEVEILAHFEDLSCKTGSSKVLKWVIRGVVEGDDIWFTEADLDVPDHFSDDEVLASLPSKTGLGEFPALRRRKKPHWRPRDTESQAFQSINAPEGSALSFGRGGPGDLGFGTDVDKPWQG